MNRYFIYDNQAYLVQEDTRIIEEDLENAVYYFDENKNPEAPNEIYYRVVPTNELKIVEAESPEDAIMLCPEEQN